MHNTSVRLQTLTSQLELIWSEHEMLNNRKNSTTIKIRIP